MDAFSLPAVVVISVLVMLLILFAFELRTLDFRYHDHYRDLKQARLDLRSAAALYMCDSTLLSGADTATVLLFGDGEEPVHIKRQRWGLYEVISIGHSLEDPFRRTYLMGKADESSCRAALWLSNRNIPLTLAGSTAIEGLVYAPQVGVKYLDLPEMKFSGRPIEADNLRPSGRYMPRLSWEMWHYLDTLKVMRELSCDYVGIQGRRVSFEEPTLYVRCDEHKEISIQLSGNAVLYGDRLVLSKDSDMRDVLVVARSVVIKSGFRGSAQFFCADSVRLESNVRLDYPSGLFIDSSGQNAPGVIIEENSVINGYVGIHWGEKYHYVLENPCFVLRDHALVHGLVYVDGSSYIQGSIKGAAYLKDCFSHVGRNMYAEALFDVSIERDDSLAFPIMIEGPYRREMMKTLN